MNVILGTICIVGRCIILMTIFRAFIITTFQPPEEKQIIPVYNGVNAPPTMNVILGTVLLIPVFFIKQLRSFPAISSYVYGFASTNNPDHPPKT
jgi:hypothetical protein